MRRCAGETRAVRRADGACTEASQPRKRCAVARRGRARERLGPAASEPSQRTREDALAARGRGGSGRRGAQTRAAISWTDMRAATSTKEVAAIIAEAKESPGGERSRDS